MSEMIERVARAIMNSDHPGFSWGSLGAPRKEMYLREARAAIEAMRSPTPEMLSAFRGVNRVRDTSERAEGWYRHMIAAALGLNERNEEAA